MGLVVTGRATSDDGSAQYVGVHGSTLDVHAGPDGISLAIYLEAGRLGIPANDLEVPWHGIPGLLDTLLFGPERESMTALAGRYMAMFTPPPDPCLKCDGSGRFEYDETAPATGPCDECDGAGHSKDKTALEPQYVLPWLMSAYLARLTEHRDYETWDEQACEDTDGMLREIITMAYALRPHLIPGVPDCPAPGHYQAAARDAAMDAIPGRLAEIRSRAEQDNP
jgi:hypothetical protein